MKLFIAIFCFCLMAGIGLAILTPAPINAGVGDPLPPCNWSCQAILCGDGCALPEYMHYRCYMGEYDPLGCTGPYNCNCQAIGCGLECNQFIE